MGETIKTLDQMWESLERAGTDDHVKALAKAGFYTGAAMIIEQLNRSIGSEPIGDVCARLIEWGKECKRQEEQTRLLYGPSETAKVV